MEEVYSRYRKEFVSWSKMKFRITEEEAVDHYQETIMAFYENTVNGSVILTDSSIKTYIFGIGKNKILQQFDANRRNEKHTPSIAEHYRFLLNDSESAGLFEQASAITAKVLESLGDGCKEILRLFYFEKRSMTEIAQALGHKNEGVTRTSKKRCLEKIRSSILKPHPDE